MARIIKQRLANQRRDKRKSLGRGGPRQINILLRKLGKEKKA